MDRRTQKTNKAIVDAFTSLLEQKRYSKITIQEIIDQADIGRSTFYSHFETKDELLKTMCTDIFDHIFELSLPSEDSHDFLKANVSYYTVITHMLYHIKDNAAVIKGVLGSESGELFMKYFKEYFNKQIEKILSFRIINDTCDIPLDFLINHISGSFIEMIRWWSQNNMRQSPEEMASYFVFVISPVIKALKMS